jgi:hypothetical protein
MNNMLVYALSHPVTGEVRYIGKSESGLQRPRQHGHLSHLKKRAHLPVARWVAKLRSEGLDYAIEVVEGCTDRLSLMEAERFYICQFRALGFRLLNVCDGGEGFTGKHSDSAKAKVAAAVKARWADPEYKARRGAAISAGKKGKMSAKVAAVIGRLHQEQIGKKQSTAQCSKRSDSLKKAWAQRKLAL